ncbi:MAG: hypothetical protein R3C17_05195 [Planctomycetaceae bacterium]
MKNADGTRTTSSYDAANQLSYSNTTSGRTTYTFDAAGNQQLELTPAGARTTTVWNYENQPAAYQLTTGSRVTMSYNADNRRVQKQTAASVSTKFIWEPTNDAYFAELDNSNTYQKVFTFEPVQSGNLISQRVGGDSFIHADALGSTRALSQGGTTVMDTFPYDAWGNGWPRPVRRRLCRFLVGWRCRVHTGDTGDTIVLCQGEGLSACGSTVDEYRPAL